MSIPKRDLSFHNELNKTISEEHNNSNETEFSCTVCFEVFSELVTLQRHYIKHVVNKPHKCSKCSKAFFKRGNLKKHEVLHAFEENICQNETKQDIPESLNNSQIFQHAYKNSVVDPTSLTLQKMGLIENQKSFKNSINRPYKCSKCSKAFFNEENLEKHLLTHDIQDPHCCDVCQKQIILKTDYDLHMQEHSVETFSCNICFKKFLRNGQLEIHEKDHVDQKPGALTYPCPLCNDLFLMKSRLENHMESHKKYNPYVCHICKRSFFFSYMLGKHLKSHFMSEKCNACFKIFNDSKSLSAHENNEHLRIRDKADSIFSYICDLCQEIFVSKDKLIFHYDNNHDGNTKYICKHCKKVFFFSCLYLEHESSHIEEKRVVQYLPSQISFDNKAFSKNKIYCHKKEKLCCEHCKKTFRYEGLLKTHSLEHTDKESYACKFCSLSFHHKENLQHHYKKHLNDKPSKNDKLRRNDINKTPLLLHKMQHRNEPDNPFKQIKCSQCEILLSDRTQLKIHLKKVHPEIHNLCNICGKLVHVPLQSSNMLHVESKPHKCDKCGRTFHYKRNLILHVSHHHPNKEMHYPFKCKYCLKPYLKESHLIVHLKNCHIKWM